MEKIKKEPVQISGIDRKIAQIPKDHIPGWGIDAAPDNDPPIHKTLEWCYYERINYKNLCSNV
jgi:hypothetical protein